MTYSVRDDYQFLTIKSVNMEKMGLVLRFVEDDEYVGLDKTDASSLAAHLGDDIEAWPGHRVVLYLDLRIRAYAEASE